MEIDFDAKASNHDLTTVPAGVYLCTVAEVRPGTTRAGDERWSLRLVVAEGPLTGTQAAWDSLVFSIRGRARARTVFRALGLPSSGRVQVEPKDIEGRKAFVEVRPVEYVDPSGSRLIRNEVPYDGYRDANLPRPVVAGYMSLRETADNIRRLLKQAGIRRSDYSVRSQSYAGGTSIRVLIDPGIEVPKSLVDEIQAHAYGDFDGMTDSYISSNHTVDFKGSRRRPGAKYVFVTATVRKEDA